MKIALGAVLASLLAGACYGTTVSLKDGSNLDAVKITEDGPNLDIQTRYGPLVLSKTDVKNLGELGFPGGPAETKPKTAGFEFISALLLDGVINIDYYANKVKIASQSFTRAGVLISQDGKVPDGTYKEYYQDGKLKKEKTIIMSQNNGPFKVYYPDGALQSEAYFINGKLNGGEREYSSGGQLLIERNFVEGELNGYLRTYDANGTLTSQILYVNGEMKDQDEEAGTEPVRKKSVRLPDIGRSEKTNSVFLEGEVFSVGGADTKWKSNLQAEVAYLGGIYNYAEGKMTSRQGMGATLGLNLMPAHKFPLYLAASYLKGPSADITIHISDPYYGTGSYSEQVATYFYRAMLGGRIVLPLKNSDSFIIDGSLGFGGGSITSKRTLYVSGVVTGKGHDSETWTGFTWSIGPKFSWEYPPYGFEFGGRYTVFPALKGSTKFSAVSWRPYSITAAFLF